MQHSKQLLFFALLLSALSLIGACSTVQPWERDLLADPAMALVSDPLEVGIDDHIYFSKEGSSGGRGFSGGGCGCN